MPFAVIFDMDGVLIDSYQPHFESWRQLYGELGREYTEAAFAADFGRISGDILRRAFGDAITDEQIHQYDDRKEQLYREIIRRDFPAMDGAVELIDALAADRFRLAVGSSGPPENIDLSLDMLGRRDRFHAVVTRVDVTRGKPDPQVFLTAAERLDTPPRRCAVVEDAVHGIEAAKRAGMVAIALTGTTSPDELAQAHLIVDSLRELTPARIRQLIEQNAAD